MQTKFVSNNYYVKRRHSLRLTSYVLNANFICIQNLNEDQNYLPALSVIRNTKWDKKEKPRFQGFSFFIGPRALVEGLLFHLYLSHHRHFLRHHPTCRLHLQYIYPWCQTRNIHSGLKLTFSYRLHITRDHHLA